MNILIIVLALVGGLLAELVAVNLRNSKKKPASVGLHEFYRELYDHDHAPWDFS